MKAPLPRLAGSGLVALLVALWTAVGVATNPISASSVEVAAWGSPSYSPDRSSFNRLSLSLVEELTGKPLEGPPKPSPLDTSKPPLDEGTGPTLPKIPDEIHVPRLRAWLSASPSSVAKPGDEIKYTLSVENTGDATATGVQLSMVLPPHTTRNKEAAPGCDPASGDGSLTKPCVEPGGLLGEEERPAQSPDEQPFSGGLPYLKPGQQYRLILTAWVQNDTPNGTDIVAQGHVSAENHDRVGTNKVVIRCRY